MHIYDKLGVRKIINAAGTYAELGGSLMPAEVWEAMRQASERYVDLPELQRKSGEYLARLIGVEAAFITTGAAAGLLLATAACIAGRDPARMAQLPDTTGLPDEIVLHRSHHNRYLQTVRLAGARLVEIGSPHRGTEPWELAEALSERTAAVLYFAVCERAGDIPWPEIIRLAHGRNVPVIVDAAAELPPATNLTSFINRGADLAVFSGGKALRGPQSTGLILGGKDLVEACLLQSSPHERLGRALKVGKEEIAGLVSAVERFLRLDHQAEEAEWQQRLACVQGRLAGLPGLAFSVFRPPHAGAAIPRLAIELDPDTLEITRDEAVRRLLEAQPSIRVGHPREHPNTLVINPFALAGGDELIVADGLEEALVGPTDRSTASFRERPAEESRAAGRKGD